MVFVDSTGNVGIGTTSPMALLHLDSGFIQDPDAKIYFTNGTGKTASIQYDGNSNGFEFRTNGTAPKDTKFFIGDNGNVDINGNLNVDNGSLYVNSANNKVGIGTTSPGSKLDIEKSGYGSGFIRMTNTLANQEAVIGVVDAGAIPGNALLFAFDEGSGTSGLGGATIHSGFGIQRTAANTLRVFTTQTDGQIRNVLDDGDGQRRNWDNHSRLQA